MMTLTPPPTYVSLSELADRTGLPLRWLRAEVNAGRLPSLKVNRRLLIPLAEAEARLAARAAEGGGDAE